MRTIGKYRIRGVLGRGGMARVYRAEHPELPRQVAIKRLEPNPFLLATLSSQTVRTLFRDEARRMAAITHPNVALVEDYVDDPVAPYYIMSWHGRSLGLLLGEGERMEAPCRRCDPDSAIRIFRQLLEGLRCLHAQEVLHLDIKPWNLLLTDHDRLVICDFGLSRLRNERLEVPENLKIGSPFYAAPEQEEDPGAASFRSDLFSAGVVLHRMLSGRYPGEIRDLEHLDPDLSHGWDELLLKACAPDPTDRFQNVGEFKSAFEAVAAAWFRHRDATCVLPPDFCEDTPVRSSLRATPLRTGVHKNAAMLGCTPLLQPARAISNAFVRHGDLVEDRLTGLLWEAGGSAYPQPFAHAAARISRFNELKKGKQTGWRLPTIPELLSLMRFPLEPRGFCASPHFSENQEWVWSADRRTWQTNWIADLRRGFAAPLDRMGTAYIRLVCSVPVTES